MKDNKSDQLNKGYAFGIIALTFLLPAASAFAEMILKHSSQPFSFELIGKWFIFYAVGFRLFIAGIRQTTNPAFTAKEIFHINSPESLPIVRELGFANLCFGLIGLVSLFLPLWRIVSSLGSGLYYGLAGLQHLLKKPAGANEKLALFTDIIIFVLLVIYFIKKM